MGLKTTNYTSKSLGVTVPEAYAVLRTLVIEANSEARAEFTVQINRAATKTFMPLDRIRVDFAWDRVTDPARMAYETAKTEIKRYEKWNEETNEVEMVEEPGALYGWENDIISGNQV